MSVQGAWLYWMVGITAVFATWWLTTRWRSRLARNQARSIVMALGLGVAMIPGPDMVILAPSTQLIVQGIQGLLGAQDSPNVQRTLSLGLGYFGVCWMAALIALFFWRPRKASAGMTAGAAYSAYASPTTSTLSPPRGLANGSATQRISGAP